MTTEASNASITRGSTNGGAQVLTQQLDGSKHLQIVGSQVPNRRPFVQQFSLTGGGGGTVNFIQDYSVTGDEAYVEAQSGEIVVVTHIDVLIGDATGLNVTNYGGATLSTGIRIRVRNDPATPADLYDLDGGSAITNLGNLLRIAKLGENLSGALAWTGGYFAGFSIDLAEAGGVVRLDATAGDYLSISLDDNFTAMVEHSWLARGYYEQTA